MPREFSSGDGDYKKYCQLMTVRTIDLTTGKSIAVLNEIDAHELGILPMERIEIMNPANGKSVNAVVDVTDSIIMENSIGIFRDIQGALDLKEGGTVHVCASGRPESIDF